MEGHNPKYGGDELLPEVRAEVVPDSIRLSPAETDKFESKDAYTDQEMELEPAPPPVFLTVKVPLTGPPFALPVGRGTAVTVYVGPATATALPDANTPPDGSSVDCTSTFI